MNRRSISSLLMFVWLVVGYAVIHGTVAIWLESMLQTLIEVPAISESLVFKENGEAVVQVYRGRSQSWSYRNLDGSPCADTYGIQKNSTKPVWFESLKPVRRGIQVYADYWPWRIASFHDFRTPATNWFLIAPPRRGNTSYFVGYDPMTRAKIGYIGTQGFSADEPTRQNSFAFPSDATMFGGSVVSAQHLQQHYAGETYEPVAVALEHQYASKANVSPDMVWILASGTVYQIRLRSRTVETLAEPSVERQNIARIEVERDDKTYLELAFRTEKELQFIDPETNQIQRIDISQIPVADRIHFYQFKNRNRILVSSPPRSLNRQEGHYSETIHWISSDGQIERQSDVELAAQKQSDPDAQMVSMFVACPAPIVPCFVALIGPLIEPSVFEDESGEPHTYAGKVGKVFGQSWGWVVLTLLCGLVVGWLCRWREVTLFANRDWLWPVLIGLTGWFGFIGYICLRPRPARLPDRQWMPPQPEPARPLGTEIFA